MQLIGHRGASATHPENTAAAFDEALARGADGVECDLHMLADGVKNNCLFVEPFFI